MSFVLTVIVVIVLVFLILVFVGWNEFRKRDKLLNEKNYFVGYRIEDVLAAIGPFDREFEHAGRQKSYVWGRGYRSVLLICDENEKVIDHCLPHNKVGAEVNYRDRLLSENGHFMGRKIEDAVAAIGPVSRKIERWADNVSYIWDTGDASVLLICDKNGRVVDYCPSRKDPQEVWDFFEKNKDVLIGQRVWDIKKTIGESHQYFKGDHGECTDIWDIGKRKGLGAEFKWSTCGPESDCWGARKMTGVVVESQDGDCTEVRFWN